MPMNIFMQQEYTHGTINRCPTNDFLHFARHCSIRQIFAALIKMEFFNSHSG